MELAFKLLMRKRSLIQTISQKKKKKKVRWFFLTIFLMVLSENPFKIEDTGL